MGVPTQKLRCLRTQRNENADFKQPYDKWMCVFPLKL